MTVLDLSGLLVGALFVRFSSFDWRDIVIGVLAVLLVLHWLLGERFPKFGKAAP